MLIKRTIDKPEEKLMLLRDYLKKESLYNELTRIKKDVRVITYNHVYIEESEICKILKISKNTLRNWNRKTHGTLTLAYEKYIRQLGSLTMRLGIRFKENFDFYDFSFRKKNYYSIIALLDFLSIQSSFRDFNRRS